MMYIACLLAASTDGVQCLYKMSASPVAYDIQSYFAPSTIVKTILGIKRSYLLQALLCSL